MYCVLGNSAMSPVLEGNDLLKNRSCSALLSSVPCSPGPGASRGVAIVCCVFSAVLFLPLYPLGQSSTEAVFACCGSVWFLAWMWHVLLDVLWYVCELRSITTTAGRDDPQYFQVGRHSVSMSLGLLGEEGWLWGTEASMTGRGSATRVGAVGVSAWYKQR